jgi:hypothetical protein
MTEWSEDHVAAIGPFKTSNSDLVDRFWINCRPCGSLRWKGEDYRLRRLGSAVWDAGTFKVVASACVGSEPMDWPPRASIERTDRILVLWAQ